MAWQAAEYRYTIEEPFWQYCGRYSDISSVYRGLQQLNGICVSHPIIRVAILARKVPSSVVILGGLDGVEIVAELAQRADSRNRAEIREMQSAKLQLIYCHQSPSTSAVVRY